MSSPTRLRSRLSVTHLEDRLVPAGTITEQIIVDQIGWRSEATKIVIFADPQTGQNAAITYVPGDAFEVRRASDDSVVFTGNTAQQFGDFGTTDPVSGDNTWHGDFTAVTATGNYYVYDPTNDLRSYTFHIGADAYNGVLETAARVFYYQRSGTAIPAEFGGNWTHGVDHVSEQNALRRIGDTPQAGTERDVSGGWWDAGDYNKYVSFTQGPIWDLLSAYEWNPGAFPDDWNIPESGNSIPDIIDLVKWETDWLLKMQLDDGSVLNRVGQTSFDVGVTPETDTQAHFYTGPTTWATASFAASAAHAARVFQPFFPEYATTLRQAAIKAWDYLNAHPNMEPADGRDGGNLAAADGSADKEGDGNAANDAAADKRIRVLAAAELYRLTGAAVYKSYFDTNYNSPALAQGGFQPFIDGQMDGSLCFDLNRAGVTYALTSGATASVVTSIKDSVQTAITTTIIPNNSADDPYLGWMYPGHYTFGSNELKANWGNLLTYGRVLDVGFTSQLAQWREASEEYLHYFHGRNALSQSYLTNLGSRGANLGVEKSVMESYHSWWIDGNAQFDGPNSTFGPAPGYVVGGPNQFFTGQVTGPPLGEPPMKSYRDFNTTFNTATGKDEKAYEVNEAAIYSQAAYLLLASQFATGDGGTSPPVPPPALSSLVVGNEGGTVRLVDGDTGAVTLEFRPFDVPGSQYTGLVQVALGDVTGDGKADLAVSAASPLGDKGMTAANAGRLRVYDGAKLAALAPGGDPETAHLYDHLPFGAGYTNGLNVALGDFDGDGLAEFIVGSRGSSGGLGNPEQGRFVVISGAPIDGPGGAVLQVGNSVNAFGNGYLKGCVVAAADLDGDSKSEVIVTRGGPVVNGSDLKVKAFRLVGAAFELVAGTEIVPFPGIKRGGRVTGLDSNGDGKDEFAITALDTDTAKVQVLIFDGAGTEQTSFTVPTSKSRPPIDGDVADFAVTSGDTDGNTTQELILVLDNATRTDSLEYVVIASGFSNDRVDPFDLVSGGVSVAGF